MNPPMISIVGKADSGKTTLIEKLIPELKRRGRRVGTIKHTSHQVDMDKKGKDSARHKAAGAQTVILASNSRITMVKDTVCDTLDDLAVYFQDMDIILTEGYKNEHCPKIEVFRRAAHKKPLFEGNKEFIALVTDADDLKPQNIPKFGLDEIKEIADFIESKFL